MRTIAAIVDMIDDELCGAKEYAEFALRWKSEHPKTAEKLHELASVEMGHVRTVHAEAERMIEEERSRSGDPPAAMLAVYDYEHQKQIKRAAEIRALIDEYDE